MLAKIALFCALCAVAYGLDGIPDMSSLPVPDAAKGLTGGGDKSPAGPIGGFGGFGGYPGDY